MPLVDASSSERELLAAIYELLKSLTTTLESLTTTLIRTGGAFPVLNVYDNGRD